MRLSCRCAICVPGICISVSSRSIGILKTWKLLIPLGAGLFESHQVHQNTKHLAFYEPAKGVRRSSNGSHRVGGDSLPFRPGVARTVLARAFSLRPFPRAETSNQQIACKPLIRLGKLAKPGMFGSEL
jgi:hypothetical protein